MSRSVPKWIGKSDDSTPPPRVRLRIFERYDGICQITQRKITPADQWDLDHAVALINGGTNDEDNLRPVLRAAHREKTAGDVKLKAKVDRVRKKHLGIHKTKATLPGSKASKFKRTIDGRTILRSET